MNPLDLRRPRALPIRVRSSCFWEWMCRPRSGRLSRARTDGVTGFVARGVHGLHENGIHRPARQVRAGVIWVRRAGRVALGTRTLERSAATAPWPDAWVCAAAWLWADVVAANSTAAAARQSASEMWRIGMAMISSVVSLGRGGKSCALSVGPKVLGRRWSAVRDPADSGGRVKGSTWNRCGRVGCSRQCFFSVGVDRFS